jgi:hypothetical protein
LNGTKKRNWIKVAPIKASPKPHRLLSAKTLKLHRVQKLSTEVTPTAVPPLDEKIEVVGLEELIAPLSVEEVAAPLVVKEVAAPSVVEEVVEPEAPQEIEVVKPIEPMSASLKQNKTPWPLNFSFFRLGWKQVKKPWPLNFSFSRFGDKVTFLALLTVAIAFLGGVSFAGLLQSTESVGTSGILVQTVDLTPPAPSSPTPTPPEPEIEIDVYSDVGCMSRLTEVEWGSIEVGDSVERVIYVRNSGDAEVFLSLLTDNWSPATSSDHMTVSWDYDGSTLRSGEVLEVVLSLDVEASIPVLGEFSFEIIIVGSAP